MSRLFARGFEQNQTRGFWMPVAPIIENALESFKNCPSRCENEDEDDYVYVNVPGEEGNFDVEIKRGSYGNRKIWLCRFENNEYMLSLIHI